MKLFRLRYKPKGRESTDIERQETRGESQYPENMLGNRACRVIRSEVALVHERRERFPGVD